MACLGRQQAQQPHRAVPSQVAIRCRRCGRETEALFRDVGQAAPWLLRGVAGLYRTALQPSVPDCGVRALRCRTLPKAHVPVPSPCTLRPAGAWHRRPARQAPRGHEWRAQSRTCVKIAAYNDFRLWLPSLRTRGLIGVER